MKGVMRMGSRCGGGGGVTAMGLRSRTRTTSRQQQQQQLYATKKDAMEGVKQRIVAVPSVRDGRVAAVSSSSSSSIMASVKTKSSSGGGLLRCAVTRTPSALTMKSSIVRTRPHVWHYHRRGLSITPGAGATSASASDDDAAADKKKEEEEETTAASAAKSASVSAATDSKNSLKMTLYFGMWYAFNIIFNIKNKETLNVFPYPYFLSTIQLGFGVLFMAVLWATKIQRFPRIERGLFAPLAAVSLFHTIGHVSSCVSFSKMAVSFTHVIKSAEPVFSVIMSSLFFGESFSGLIWLSLVPIVLGCSFAAMKEVSFNISGFNGAMLSNFAFVLRNILSKKYMVKYKETIDGINLYGLISVLSLGYMIPLALVMEGPAMWDAGFAVASAKMGAAQLWKLIAVGGITYHLYNQTSYMALTGISAVTFSVRARPQHDAHTCTLYDESVCEPQKTAIPRRRVMHRPPPHMTSVRSPAVPFRTNMYHTTTSHTGRKHNEARCGDFEQRGLFQKPHLDAQLVRYGDGYWWYLPVQSGAAHRTTIEAPGEWAIDRQAGRQTDRQVGRSVAYMSQCVACDVTRHDASSISSVLSCSTRRRNACVYVCVWDACTTQSIVLGKRRACV